MPQSTRPTIEWPTLAVAAAIYAGFAALTLHYHDLPWWVVAPAGAYLIAWHGSLQHEVVHGHPTPRRGYNEALVYPSLWLWMPFRVYRATHEAHHRTASLTDPVEDPESFYLSAADWARAGRVRRVLLIANNTALGRLVLGPPLGVAAFLFAEARAFGRGDGGHAGAWGHHVAGCAIVLGWVVGVCDVALSEYVALIAAPGVSLTYLRSFAEHRASADPETRTAIVEAGPLMSLLYLNNNLHVVHHREPGLPWYALPARWRAQREGILAANGGYRYRGYLDVVTRHALRPRAPVVHPAR